MTTPTPPPYGTDEWADAMFPDRGAEPSMEVTVDLDAEAAPNTDHPGDE